MSIVSPTRCTRAFVALVATLSSALLAVPASAQIVFSNGTPNNINVGVSDVEIPQYLADTFTFGGSTTFNTIVWYGVYAGSDTPTTPDIFTIDLFNTTSGVPNTAPFQTINVGNSATRTPTGATISPFGYTIYQYSYVLPSSATLPAGTYGLGIFNDTTADTDDLWAWATSDTTSPLFFRFTPTSAFSTQPAGNLAFILANAPEPGTLALLALGTIAAGGIAARRRQSERGN